jgi:hypothetical protein
MVQGDKKVKHKKLSCTIKTSARSQGRLSADKTSGMFCFSIGYNGGKPDKDNNICRLLVRNYPLASATPSIRSISSKISGNKNKRLSADAEIGFLISLFCLFSTS